MVKMHGRVKGRRKENAIADVMTFKLYQSWCVSSVVPTVYCAQSADNVIFFSDTVSLWLQMIHQDTALS